MAAPTRYAFARVIRLTTERMGITIRSACRTLATVNNDTGSADSQVTHTGQKFEDSDYRLARFTTRPKEVNERFAIDLIDEIQPTPVHSSSTWCEGGGGPLGHPKVYINVDQPGNHACGYCGLRFYKAH